MKRQIEFSISTDIPDTHTIVNAARAFFAGVHEGFPTAIEHTGSITVESFTEPTNSVVIRFMIEEPDEVPD